MTETVHPSSPASLGKPRRGRLAGSRSLALQITSALACAALGFALVAQLQAGEDLGERLDIEREEDLAQILADLSAQSDGLQSEITDLRLTLLAFQSSAEREDLALKTLRDRLNELRVLSGTARVRGTGIRFEVADPNRQVSQAEMVDTIQELRDAGAEAIAVGDVRLVASSAFVTRNGRLLVDGRPIDRPYVITAVGPAETIAKALAIPGGAIDALEALPQVKASVQTLRRLTIPARPEPVPFVYAEPVEAEDS